MGTPKSFRDLMAAPKTLTIRTKTAPSPPPLVQVPPGYFEQKAIQQKEMLRLVNSHRCPLCGSQLDGGVYATAATVYCSANPAEYECKYRRGLALPELSTQRITYGPNQYEIQSQHIYDETYHNIIFLVDMTMNIIHRDRSKKKIVDLKCTRIVLNPDMDEPRFLKKIKSYRLFG